MARSDKSQRKRHRDKPLTVYYVSQIIQEKKITKRVELVCLAVQQKRERKTALAEFIANKGKIYLQSLLQPCYRHFRMDGG